MNNLVPALKRITTLQLLLLLGSIGINAYGQGTFVSGSTGADGAFNPTTTQEIQLPESGVFNFTTINIPYNVTISFKKNTRNTPVIMLATGDVFISGRIDLSGSGTGGRYGGPGGPGGFKGGDGGWALEHPDGFPGEGPGGGLGGIRLPNGTSQWGGPAGHRFDGDGINGGKSYGNNQVSLLIGGSGGGGGSASLIESGCGGGGGGGAIILASTTNISFGDSGSVIVNGGRACEGWGPNWGSAGSIRVVANKISGSAYFGTYPLGYLRVEAYDKTKFFSNPTTYSLGLPGPVILPTLPTLVITSVGGFSSPANPAASFRANPDIIIPKSVSNPVTVNIQATNIPVGTVVQIMQTSEVNVRTIINSTPLAGTNASSTATATVTLPTTGMCILNASATLNALTAFGYPVHYDGERVDKVEIAANDDKSSAVFLVTLSGKRVKWPN